MSRDTILIIIIEFSRIEILMRSKTVPGKFLDDSSTRLIINGINSVGRSVVAGAGPGRQRPELSGKIAPAERKPFHGIYRRSFENSVALSRGKSMGNSVSVSLGLPRAPIVILLMIREISSIRCETSNDLIPQIKIMASATSHGIIIAPENSYTQFSLPEGINTRGRFIRRRPRPPRLPPSFLGVHYRSVRDFGSRSRFHLHSTIAVKIPPGDSRRCCA